MSFVVVTVNYKTPLLTVECLRSLSAEIASTPDVRAMVVDNASGDGSVDIIARAIRDEGWGSWASVTGMPVNGGFSYGNNAAIRLAKTLFPQFTAIFLLNPDAQIQPGSLNTLATFLEQHPKAGILGTGIRNGDGHPEPSAHTFFSPLGELEGSARFSPLTKVLGRYVVTPPIAAQAHRCDWVSGAGMVIRRTVLDSAGLFDEGYFLYFEEVDLCRRAANAGWECWYVPEAGIVHLEGASTGITEKRRRRPGYWYDSRRRFFAKYHGRRGLMTADFLWFLGRGSLLFRRFLGLVGTDGQGDEPLHWVEDLLGGDWKALFGGGLGRKKLENRY